MSFGYSWNNTICIYTQNTDVIKQTEEFAEKYSMKVLIADSETDLIGVPYWLAVIDITLLKGEYFDYLKDVDEGWIIDESIITSEDEKELLLEAQKDNYISEKIITHTKPTEVPDWLSPYLIINEHITLENLESICKPFFPTSENNTK